MANAMTRLLKLQKGGTAQDVPIRLSWPISDGKAWDCQWEIGWPDLPRANSGRGVDAIQALMNALTMIGAERDASEAHKSGWLSWRDDWRGYGFPLTVNLRDVLGEDDERFL